MEKFKYSAVNEAPIYESVKNGKGVKTLNKLLMGTYVTILDEIEGWYKVTSVGSVGWMRAEDLTDNMGLKMFFVDVGQGDAMLLEVGKYRILIDGGPNNNMYGYLTKWQYSYLLTDNEKIHIDFVIITHFDTDHYKGFVKIIDDPRFTFGSIIHPGILKYANAEDGEWTKIGRKQGAYLYDKSDDLTTVDESIPFSKEVTNFIRAVKNAKSEGRLARARRYEKGSRIINRKIEGKKLCISILAPVLEKVGNRKMFAWFGGVSETINGHSMVLKIEFGEKTILVTGDLNSRSQNYLLSVYGDEKPFDVDVAKSSHHGSSDFSVEFMQAVSAYATVFSSGDNESYSHPRADAIGCAGKYSKSLKPLVYSTELARSVDMRTRKILFGMINLRTDGQNIYMSQMRESKGAGGLWDSYLVQ